MNISAFLIGAATAFFTIFALHILCWRKRRTRFQTVVGIIMAVWAVWCAKDMVTTFPDMYCDSVLRWIFIADAWSALTYTVFIMEVVHPGWVTWRRLALQALPFALFTAAYAIWPRIEVIYAYAIFLWFYAWTVVIVGYVRMTHYLRYVCREFSNIDNIDASWLKPIFLFAVIGQLAWLFTSFYSAVLIDILYYVCIIALWLLVLHYSWDFQPIELQRIEESEVDSDSQQEAAVPHIAPGRLEQVVESQQLYLHPDLTLQELAVVLGTNRTYVSNYLSHVLGVTFYDYINQLRIERHAIPLITDHPEYTFEYVARQSGFSSISTFRRAFAKNTGKTPSQYAASLPQ